MKTQIWVYLTKGLLQSIMKYTDKMSFMVSKVTSMIIFDLRPPA